MAKPQHLSVVRRGKDAVQAWLWQASERRVAFFKTVPRGANGLPLFEKIDRSGIPEDGLDLKDANLRGIQLQQFNLTQANLEGANLAGANLTGAELATATLDGADLTKASLAGTDLTQTFMNGACLRDAYLAHTMFIGTYLHGTDFTRAQLSSTLLCELDLSQTKGLGQTVHLEQSSVDVETLVRSIRRAGHSLAPDLETFFRATGVPQDLLAILPRMIEGIKYHSCFISHGQPDVKFAKRLYGDLQARGVNCWRHGPDATPGQPTQGEIKRKIREADKAIFLCSAKSLIREGVLIELEELIDHDPTKLIPVSLDNIWTQPGFRVMRGNRDLAPWLRMQNYVDFPSLGYLTGFRRLLSALERVRVVTD